MPLNTNDNSLQEIAKKWKMGQLTEEEKVLLYDWDNSHKDDELLLRAGIDDAETIKSEMFKNIKRAMVEEQNAYELPKWRQWKAYAVAAVAILIVGTGLFMQKQTAEVKIVKELVQVEDIPAGTQSATLTLSNGNRIVLNSQATEVVLENNGLNVDNIRNGKLVYSANVKSTQVLMNTLTTGKGEKYQVVLSDGTKVWINTASKITYPSTFSKSKERIVQLDGEAYFEVAKDKNHPFIVNVKGLSVVVMGTRFNVNSYADEPQIQTALVEGKVKVIPNNAIEKAITLKPGQEALLKGNSLSVEEVNTDAIIAWKDGEFNFNHEPLEAIMRKIARWYNVEVEYTDDKIRSERFGGAISCFGNVSDVLRMLELTGNVHFKIEGRKIIVKK